jgi:hypothetical protein
VSESDTSSFSEAPAVPAAPFWRPFCIREHEGKVRHRAPVGARQFIVGLFDAFRRLSLSMKFVSAVLALQSAAWIAFALMLGVMLGRSGGASAATSASGSDVFIRAGLVIVGLCLPVFGYLIAILAPWLDPALATRVLRSGKCPACAYPLAASISECEPTTCTECAARWFPRPLPQPAIPPPAPTAFHVPHADWTSLSLRVTDHRGRNMPVLLQRETAYPEPKPDRAAAKPTRWETIAMLVPAIFLPFVLFPLVGAGTQALVRGSLGFLVTSGGMERSTVSALEAVVQFASSMTLLVLLVVVIFRVFWAPRAFKVRLVAWRCAACGGPLGSEAADGCRSCQRCNAAWRLQAATDAHPSFPSA